MSIDIPAPLLNEDFAACLVQRYLDESSGRARYSGAYFDRLGGRGDQGEAASQFAAEDLLAITMLSVRIEGYHALEILHYRAGELNGLLSEIPVDVPLQAPEAGHLIRENGPARRLWDAICDIEPRPEKNSVGPITAGKLLARKRPDLLPVYDSRIKKVSQQAPRRQRVVAPPARRPRQPPRVRPDARVRPRKGQCRQHVAAAHLRRHVLDVQLGKRAGGLQSGRPGLR